MTKILKNLLLLISIVVTVLYFSSCEQYQYLVENDTPPPSDTTGNDSVVVISFKKSVEPLFTVDNCIACHKSGKNPDLRTGFAYQSLKTGGFVDQPASTSKLYVKITKDAGHSSMMPLKASKDTIYMWIDQGSKDN
jgi:hypothetical protein